MDDRIRAAIAEIKPASRSLQKVYRSRLDVLTKPRGSLGRLEELAWRWAALRHPDLKTIHRRRIYTFAADHGIAAAGVSAYPAQVTAQMVRNFLAGGAAVSVMCRHYDTEIVVVDMGVAADFADLEGLEQCKIGYGTRNFLEEPAMSIGQAEESVVRGIEYGRNAAAAGMGLVGTGDMGIGNTSSSAAVLSVLTGMAVRRIAGRGTGLDEAGLKKKIAVIEAGVERRAPDASNPLDVLAKLGGFEIGAITGLVLGAASCRIPVVVDGFISTAGALAAIKLCPPVRDWLFFSHASAEKGHRQVLRRLGVRPLLDLGMRLGEGTGAVLAMDIIRVAVKLMMEMATFEEAGVSREEGPPAAGQKS